MVNFPDALPSSTPLTHGELVDEVVAIAGFALMLSNRNRIINGNFRTNQREYASGAALASGSYGFDRWKSTAAGSSMTFAAAPQGQTVTINSGGQFAQVIPREDMEAGSYRLSKIGTCLGRIYNVGGTPPTPGGSGSSWTIDGTADVMVEFVASGGTKTLGEVQVESTNEVTQYEHIPALFELILCQKFFWLEKPGIASVPFACCYPIQAYQATGIIVVVKHPVPMRATPLISTGGSGVSVTTANGGQVATTLGIDQARSTKYCSLGVGVSSGLVAGNAGIIMTPVSGGATSYISGDSEL